MGDRAQVYMQDVDVYLYTHWEGSELLPIVAQALNRKQRWDDPEYLARIIFCEMIGDDVKGEVGFGIGNQQHGDVWRVVKINCSKQTVKVIDKGRSTFTGTFEEFIGKELK